MSTRVRSSLLFFIILIAFALRVYRLDAQSIWYDEGLSIYLAQQSPDQTIALSATTDHPPLHALLLGGWIDVAGDSDFIVRFLSVFFGLLVVALTYTLGKLLNERVGLITAFLMSIAPMAVYYSQETRGYMLLTALSLLAAIAFVRLLLGHENRRTWLIYGVSMVGALYTHYFAAFAWIAFNVAFMVALLFSKSINHEDAKTQRNLRVFLSSRLAQWIIVQILIAVCFLPWLPNAIAQAAANATYFPGRVTWDTVVGDTWRAFTVGEWGNGSSIGWAWLILIAVGVLDLFYRRDAENAGKKFVFTSLLWLIVPLVLMSALAWLKPKFAPRYLLPSLPAFVLLTSMGITNLAGLQRPARFVGMLLGAALIFFNVQSLSWLYFDPSIARPDVRSVAAYIQSHAQPSDAIILIGGHQAPAFDHYYRGSNDVIPMPPDLLPAPQSPIDARSIAQLADIAAKHPRVWLVLWQNEISDPMNVIEDALTDQGQRLEVGQNFHDMALQLFDVRAAHFPGGPQNSIEHAFMEPIKLIGYNMNSTPIRVGTSLSIGLYLTAVGSIQGNYQVFAHLVDVNGSIAAQQDRIAGADSYPTSLWQRGSVILNRFEISVPLDALPGTYTLQVGLYDSAGRLKLIDGSDHIDLVQLQVDK